MSISGHRTPITSLVRATVRIANSSAGRPALALAEVGHKRTNLGVGKRGVVFDLSHLAHGWECFLKMPLPPCGVSPHRDTRALLRNPIQPRCARGAGLPFRAL